MADLHDHWHRSHAQLVTEADVDAAHDELLAIVDTPRGRHRTDWLGWAGAWPLRRVRSQHSDAVWEIDWGENLLGKTDTLVDGS